MATMFDVIRQKSGDNSTEVAASFSMREEAERELEALQAAHDEGFNYFIVENGRESEPLVDTANIHPVIKE